MSKEKRKYSKSGWVDYKKHPRGPNGRGLCRWCGQEVPKGKRTWCSPFCIHQHKIRVGGKYQAKIVWERDAGICDICGINAEAVRAEYFGKLSKLRKDIDNLYWGDEDGNVDHKAISKHRKEQEKLLQKTYTDKGWNIRIGRWWEVDHILPVTEGGGPDEWGRSRDYLENLRTLCVPCHKKVTKELRKRLAEKNGKTN